MSSYERLLESPATDRIDSETLGRVRDWSTDGSQRKQHAESAVSRDMGSWAVSISSDDLADARYSLGLEYAKSVRFQPLQIEETHESADRTFRQTIEYGGKTRMASSNTLSARRLRKRVRDTALTSYHWIRGPSDMTFREWLKDIGRMVGRGFKSATNTVYRKAKGPPNMTLRERLRAAWKSFLIALTDTWMTEMICIAVAIAITIGLAVLFNTWNGAPLASWSARLSITTVIAILSKMSQVLLAIPIASCLSQVGWLHFSKRNSVLDFQRFDRATRSPFGTARLLLTQPSWLVALGFTTVVLGFAFEPAAQECLQVIPVTEIPILTQFTVPTGSAAILYEAMLSAAISSFYTTDDYVGFRIVAPPSLNYPCTTSDCSVAVPYATLSFCASCVDISNQLREAPSGVFTLPDGSSASNQTHSVTLSSERLEYETSESPEGPILYLANFTIIESLPGDYTPNATSASPVAQRCFVSLCCVVYQLNIENGVTAATGAQEVMQSNTTQYTVSDNGNWTITNPSGHYSTPTGPFGIDTTSLVLLADLLAGLFNGSSASSSMQSNQSMASGFAQSPVGPRLWTLVENFFVSEGSPYQPSSLAYISSFAISNIVTSMANAARAYLSSYAIDPYQSSLSSYYIRWPWFTLPVVVELLVIILLLSVREQTRRKRLPIWKTSAIAIMFRGVAQSLETTLSQGPTISEMERAASDKHAILVMTSSGQRLVDIEEDPTDGQSPTWRVPAQRQSDVQLPAV